MVNKMNDAGLLVFNGHNEVAQKALPFQPSLADEPNKATQMAMQRVDDYVTGKNREGFKSYSSVEELMADIEF
jgi:hypothetical protein